MYKKIGRIITVNKKSRHTLLETSKTPQILSAQISTSLQTLALSEVILSKIPKVSSESLKPPRKRSTKKVLTA